MDEHYINKGMTVEEFADMANKLRLQRKDKWVFMSVELVDGRQIQYKAFNKYIQRLHVDGMSTVHTEYSTVREFKEALRSIA